MATVPELENRVNELEQRLGRIERLISADSTSKDWRRTVGMFAGDAEFEEIVRLGREWRERENKRSLE